MKTGFTVFVFGSLRPSQQFFSYVVTVFIQVEPVCLFVCLI